MIISNDALRAFNAGIRPSFNDAVNQRDRRGTIAEHQKLRIIYLHYYGTIGKGKLTRSQINEYQVVFGDI